VVEVRLDCDGDAVLYRVDQTGPACHTGARTCFSAVLDGANPSPAPGADPGGHLLSRLATTIARRAEERAEGSYTVKLLDRGVAKIAQKVGEEAVETVVAATIASRAGERPAGSYTVKLLDRGVAKIAQKVGEEAVETVVAATAEDDNRLAAESADLLYHLLVLLQSRGVPLERVWDELERRER
jgi:phosphoribosyl-ATP pyrophosphohydrolase/phosphoribosyl-AMP cyclohydrolase